MKNIKLMLFICFGLTLTSKAQTYILNTDLGTINTCSGIFYDSGGPSGNYEIGQNRWVTFCPEKAGDILRIDFGQLCVRTNPGGCLDKLNIYQGDKAYADLAIEPDDIYCGTNIPPPIIASNSSGCITINFESIVGPGSMVCGWAAYLNCVTPCVNPTANLIDNSSITLCSNESINPGNHTVSVDASNSFPGSYTGDDTHDLANYYWNWGDGTKTTSTSPSQTHTYTTPGIYRMNLVVGDDNYDFLSSGCLSTNSASKDIIVLPPPSFDKNINILSCDNCAEVNISAITNTISNAVDTSVEPLVLEDMSGFCYSSTINYDGLFEDSAVVTEDCWPTVCFDLDHSWAGDLIISIIAPDGKKAVLYNRYGGDKNFGNCTTANDDGSFGCPRTYCVNSTDGDSWITALTDSGVACNGCSLSEKGGYYVEGTYLSLDSFEELNGAPLNGTWTLEICDMMSLDDGVLHSWELNFPSSCIVPSLEVSPKITNIIWDSEFANINTTYTDISPSLGLCPINLTCDGTELNSNAQICNPSSNGYSFFIVDEYNCQYEGITNLTINLASTSTIDISECESYTAPDNQTHTTSGTKTAIISNTHGCDSTITINLTIKNPSTSNITESVCDSYTAPDGQIYTSSGIKTSVIPNHISCDSIITIDLIVNNSSNSNLNAISCNTYTAPDGQIFNSSGNYISVIPNHLSCDSTISINLVIRDSSELSTEVVQLSDSLVSLTLSSVYQWIDCNSNSEILGETNYFFKPNKDGKFAVILKNEACEETSECFDFILPINTPEITEITIYPNPNNGSFSLMFPFSVNGFINISDVLGKIQYNSEVSGIEHSVILNAKSGIYFISIILDTGENKVIKFIIQ
jgi:subtilisin-like proprotein convertase family protein